MLADPQLVRAEPYLSPDELRQLTPGVLDDKAVEFFANGKCASMALAIHLLTGWPQVRFVPRDENAYCHCAVEPERGCFLDAEGLGAWNRFRAFHGDAFDTMYRGVRELNRYGRIYESIGLVLPYAELVLDRHLPDWRARR